MTASPRSARPAAARALLGFALCAALAGCRTPAVVPEGSPFEGELRFAAHVPDVADHTAAELAAAALRSDRSGTESALGRLRAIETVLEAWDERPTGLLPLSSDLANAALDDPRAYREASLELLERDALDPELEARLEQMSADDPLALAARRTWDHRLMEFGRLFNRLAEPLGRSILTTALLPYQLGRGALAYAVEMYVKEPLSLWQRQALVHQTEFLERHPDTPEAREIRPRVYRGQARWTRTLGERAAQAARRALDRDSPRLALVYSHRALRLLPEHRSASQLRDEAARDVLRWRARQARSLEAGPGENTSPEGRALGLALLDPGGDVAGRAGALLSSDPEGPLADEARFALALARAESGVTGAESAAWRAMGELADRPDERLNMARHARALTESPTQHPHAAFRRTRRAYRKQRAAWVMLGRFARAPPERGLPRALEWAIALPSLVQSLVTFPIRLIQLPWQPPSSAAREVAAHGRRYLARHPDGEHAPEVRDWLVGLARQRGHWVGVLELEEQRPGADPEELAGLREKAADQMLDFAREERSATLRNALYRRIAREYRETRAGRRAAQKARLEAESLTPRYIQLTRGFLLENRELAGPRGLSLRPGLLDGELNNGELHREGVALLGGRAIEVSWVAASGDEDDPPERRREDLSDRRLARLVSLLEETAYRNALVDPDNDVAPDAHRDAFFERARLGMADQVDDRDISNTEYAYRGMRERYGLVRSRESILPFDLVVKGSLSDLSFGAFPRIRQPRRTPDAFLYE